MEILNGNEPASIEKALAILKGGDIVAFPTETVYGLGADALNPYAVAKIFEVKKRPKFDPLIVHIGDREWLSDFAGHVPAEVIRLTERFWPGPLTVILPKRSIIPDIVTAGLTTVGIRMPSHPVALNLIKALQKPIAAPSANPFGYMSPTKAGHVAKMLKDRLSLVLDGGDSVFGIESTIISCRDGRVHIHRHGAITVEELEEVVGKVSEKREDGTCESPGELPFHYAPSKPLKIITSMDEIRNRSASLLAFREPPGEPGVKHVRVLSPDGNLRVAAANFFSYLIELDSHDVDVIYAEKIPEQGIGKAMMERLRKASKKYHPEAGI
ncbi:MAG: Threonylcarbamoyl-AMP synthase [Syntrophorhabdus sp. PtaU1.Bin058]|nr:MAG: Threonylcarbamoyl-AMP synthase [Syntrophorhabdus sp. PtaU1.Bin058]